MTRATTNPSAMPSRAVTGALAVLLAIMAAPAWAATADPATIIIPDSGDTAWLLGCTILALLTALPGALLYGIGIAGWGSAPRIITAAIASAALATLLYFVIGYSLMFDPNPDLPFGAWLGGAGNIMLNGMGTVREGTTVPETGFVLFQLGFVLLAVTLLAALVAPRARAGWMLGFAGLWLLLVLVPVTRWLWGGGWLAAAGAIDAAGGLTVFYCTAVSAVVALALIGGPARSDAVPDGATRLIGAFLLLVGLAALAGGATLGASDNSAVAMLAMLTAAMAGALSFAALSRSLDAVVLASGLVAGIAAISACGDGVSIGGALIIGVVGALVMALSQWIVLRFLPASLTRADPDGAIFGLIGAAKTGVLLFAIFLAFQPFGGSGYADGMTMTGQFIAQLIAICAVAAWSVIGTLIAALMVGLVLPMRDWTTD